MTPVKEIDQQFHKFSASGMWNHVNTVSFCLSNSTLLLLLIFITLYLNNGGKTKSEVVQSRGLWRQRKPAPYITTALIRSLRLSQTHLNSNNIRLLLMTKHLDNVCHTCCTSILTNAVRRLAPALKKPYFPEAVSLTTWRIASSSSSNYLLVAWTIRSAPFRRDKN